MDNLFDIEKSKLAAFGQWLTERTIQQEQMLYSVCSNVQQNVDAIRLKYGHMEAYKTILQAFADLYQKDLKDFEKEYLDKKEEDESTD